MTIGCLALIQPKVFRLGLDDLEGLNRVYIMYNHEPVSFIHLQCSGDDVAFGSKVSNLVLLRVHDDSLVLLPEDGWGGKCIDQTNQLCFITFGLSNPWSWNLNEWGKLDIQGHKAGIILSNTGCNIHQNLSRGYLIDPSHLLLAKQTYWPLSSLRTLEMMKGLTVTLGRPSGRK